MATRHILSALIVLGCATQAAAQETPFRNRTANTFTASAEVPSPRATLQDMSWLTGQWSGTGLGGMTEEMWSDPASGARKYHLHCYAAGDHSFRRHLAFRDYLRARPDMARAYEEMKHGCAPRHPDDSHANTECKDRWIKRVEAEALNWSESASPRK